MRQVNFDDGRHYLNIGLYVGRTREYIKPEDVLSKIEKHVRVVSACEVKDRVDAEPTLLVEIAEKISEESAMDICAETKQQAIVYLGGGQGIMFDTKAGTKDAWGEFNPHFFLMHGGVSLTGLIQSRFREAKELLKKHGFYVDNLWHVSDVTSFFDCTDEQAREVLDDVLTNLTIIRGTKGLIKYTAELIYSLTPKS